VSAREDLDACANSPTCTADVHVMACPGLQSTNLAEDLFDQLAAFPVAGAGVWAVYYADRSAVWVFAREIEALRCAVDKSAQVAWWPFGEALAW